MILTVVKADEWCAIYANDTEIFQHHSIGEFFANDRAVNHAIEEHGPIEKMLVLHLTEAGELELQAAGYLPESLSAIKREWLN